MKQSLKYGLLLVLALLIHSVSSQTMENNRKELSLTDRQEKCFVSQNNPFHNALEHLYYLYTTRTCDLSHADIAHVPADKSIQLPVSYSRGHKYTQYRSYTHTHYIPKYLSDPITHYIYGLRKIII